MEERRRGVLREEALEALKKGFKGFEGRLEMASRA